MWTSVRQTLKSFGYQKWHLVDIIKGDIWLDIQSVEYHPSWYPTHWYLKIKLDIKDELISSLDIIFKVGHQG